MCVLELYISIPTNAKLQLMLSLGITLSLLLLVVCLNQELALFYRNAQGERLISCTVYVPFSWWLVKKQWCSLLSSVLLRADGWLRPLNISSSVASASITTKILTLRVIWKKHLWCPVAQTLINRAYYWRKYPFQSFQDCPLPLQSTHQKTWCW